MKFKNYCVVSIGKVDGVKDIIVKLSESTPRYLEQKGVFIGTFSCIMSAKELGDILNREQRTFFIFEVGDESNCYRIGREDIHNQLFGHIEDGGDEILNILSNNLMNDIRMTGSTNNKIDKSVSLNEQLEQAIEEENYDRAAELRDLIKLKESK